ncbi:decarboxylase [Paenibacillus sp. CFBP13512]|uniref:decarboxylase n=1 Tax=Paenibacillus sp. CFBP13512 TaxID=2184007 RepID=UPI0010C13BCD|nr:decarboxylase [Paenibacillus sp. CFBP13512]TKJ93370.1 decarboxylase [Paenibacillus sp. CFBP13512]
MNLKELRKKYGSPLYIYDLGILRQSYRRLKQSLPESSILFYSLKANPHPLVVKQLIDLGCRAEVSSLGELNSVLEAGGDIEGVLYTGPGKNSTELKTAIEIGVRWFSIESLNELRTLQSLLTSDSPTIQVIIRINPKEGLTDAGLFMTGTSSQFGMDEEIILRELNELQQTNQVQIVGFHIFNGTNTLDIGVLSKSFLSSIQVIAKLSKKLGIPLKFIDLGGGFGHPYAINGSAPDFKELKTILETALDEHIANWRNGEPEVAFESGRYLTAASGALVSTVIDMKESKGNHFIILDSGINHLGGMAGLGRIPRVKYDILPVVEKTNVNAMSVQIVGPLCTPLDFFNKKGSVPSLELEDQVYIPNVGAYGITASLIGFLSRDMPIELIIDKGEVMHASQLFLNRKVISE